MSVLIVVGEDLTQPIPLLEEHVTVACVGLEDRIGDKYQSLRDRGGVVFTGGMDPVLYLAKHGLTFELVIDGRYGSVKYNAYKGIDHIPD